LSVSRRCGALWPFEAPEAAPAPFPALASPAANDNDNDSKTYREYLFVVIVGSGDKKMGLVE